MISSLDKRYIKELNKNYNGVDKHIDVQLPSKEKICIMSVNITLWN